MNWLLILGFAFFFGCSSKRLDQFKGVQKGVERSELISLLSEPNVYFKFGNAEYYIFQKKFIEFKDNKVWTAVVKL